ALVDRGATRDEILRTTGVVLGAAGVNLSIEPSEICVLMGLSGSGKSTMLRTSRIAMVFQQFALLPWRTVKENVAFGLELRRMPKAEIDRIVADKLAM